MALTIAQTQALWRVQNRARFSYYRKYNRVWAKYYAEQGRILLENLDKNQPETYIFDESEVAAIYTAMYIDVGVAFAEMSQTGVGSGFIPDRNFRNG